MQGSKFEWGKNDCLTFTNGAFRSMYGEGWADDWLGRYMVGRRPMHKYELIEEFGTKDFIGEIDKKLKRIDFVPPLGALVTTKQARRWVTGVALGISNGTRSLFLGEVGFIQLPFEEIENAWVKT